MGGDQNFTQDAALLAELLCKGIEPGFDPSLHAN